MRLVIPHPPSYLAKPIGDPLLAISDIHGDIKGLEAVLNSVSNIPLSGIVAAGDHCFGGDHPFQVWQRLRSLGAKMTRGASDFALGMLQVENLTPYSKQEEDRIQQFLWTKGQLGEVVCRRLANLPITEVVSMDDRSGVMVVHGSPQDPLVALTEDMSVDALSEATVCIAEDVLVVGMTHRSFVRQQKNLLVVNAGSVGERFGPERFEHTAHVTLLQGYDDNTVRAYAYDIRVGDESRVGVNLHQVKRVG